MLALSLPKEYPETMFLRFVVAVSLLLSSTASAQAVMRPAPYRPPPAYTPGYAPGTPAEPVYAPVGAGVPGERVPGPVVPAVPRSPNKRVLPASGEPGLWAADGALRASGLGVTVLGVAFDLGLDLKPARAAAECAKAVNDAADSTHLWSEHTSRFPEEAMRCIAARALLSCATAVRDELQSQKRTFADFRAEHATIAAEAARLWEKKYCDGVTLDHTQDSFLSWLRPRTESIRPKR